MDALLKIDPHTHSKGISQCSVADYREIIDGRKRAGYDGIFLTNHCQPWYYPPAEHKQFIERVIEEFLRAKAYGEGQDFRVYLGIEITTVDPTYADWLLYGVTEEFLRATPCLYECPQERLFAFCEEAGVLMIQAHPYRGGGLPRNPKYMHGVEINCTAIDVPKAELVVAFAKENGLLVTCGTDYHGEEREVLGGIYVPKHCQTAQEVAKYLRENKCYFCSK